MKTFPSSRLFTFNIGKLGMRKHHIKAVIEVDVTDSRVKIKSVRNRSENRVSFTSWMLKCIGQAVEEHKQVHALRKGKKKLVIFDDIDISIMVEKKVHNEPVPIPLVIRNVNTKEIPEIYQDIEDAKKEVIRDESDYVLEKNRKKEPIKLFSFLPPPIRLFI